MSHAIHLLRRSVCALASTGLLLAATTQASEPADLRATLETLRAKSPAPALAGAIYRDGKLIGVGVCGKRSSETSDAAAPDDRFPIGSCTKPMTRLVILRLTERGTLDLDAPLSAQLDGVEMRDDYRTVTFADLLSHRAGIQPYERIGPKITPFLFALTGTPTEQRAAFAKHVLSEPPAAPPRTRFVYSNAGFCIVAAIAEHKSHSAWEQLVRSEVFQPLNLSTAIVGDEAGEQHPLTGHRQTPEGLKPGPALSRLPAMIPAGGVRLSVADFAAFASAQSDLQAGRPVAGISEKTLARARNLGPADGAPPLAAGGATYGGDGLFNAAFAVWPEQRVAIAVACNVGDADDLCTEAIEAIRNSLAPDISPVGVGGPGPGAPPGGPRYGFSVNAEAEGPWSIGPVEPGSIAEKAGLKKGDTILEINGNELQKITENDRMSQIRANQLTLTVERDGKRMQIKLMK